MRVTRQCVPNGAFPYSTGTRNCTQRSYRGSGQRTTLHRIALRTPAPGARTATDCAVVDRREHQDQRLPVRIARARRRVAVAVGHLSTQLHPRVRRRHRAGCRHDRARVPRAISRSARTTAARDRSGAGIRSAARRRCTIRHGAGKGLRRRPPARGRHQQPLQRRPPAARHPASHDCGRLRRRRGTGHRFVRLHRVRPLLAAARGGYARLLPGSDSAAWQYAGGMPAGEPSGAGGTVQSVS